MTEQTLNELAPVVEKALSLKAAAEFHMTASAQLEAQDRPTDAQVQVNKAVALTTEASRLMIQARVIARAAGTALPGESGLRAIADRAA